MKKALILLLALAALFMLSGCKSGEKNDEAAPTPGQTGVYSPLTPADDNLDDSLDEDLSTLPEDLPDLSQDDSLAADTPAAGVDSTAISPLAAAQNAQDEGDDLLTEDDPLLDEEDSLDDLPDEDPMADSQPASGAAQTPEAPVTEIPIKEYKYETYTDTALGISVDYPSHWEMETGSGTITFTEPVASGTPMRLALSIKSHEGKLTNDQAKKQFNEYLSAIRGDYKKFAKSKVDTKVTFMNRRGWGCQYKAQLEKKNVVSGYVAMVHVEQSNQIVALHFSAPQSKYNKTTRSMFKTVMYSVTRLPGNTDT